MTDLPNPFRDAYPWNHAVIGQVLVPGVIESIGSPSKPHIWVFQQGLTAWNAVSIWRGQKLAEGFSITTRIIDAEQFDLCYKFRDTLQPKLGRKPPVLPILNGALNFIGVKRVAVKNIIPPETAEGLSWRLVVELCEYNPMKAVPVGPADPPETESENARLARQVEEKVAQARKL